MKYKCLHSWNISPKEGIAIQKELKEKLVFFDGKFRVENICGTDVSYEKEKNLLFSAVVILKYPEMDVIEEQTAIMKCTFPYVPGLLSFREVPVLLKAFDNINDVPDVVLCDGHGIAHPRGFGLASHLGMILDIPTIGCAKKKLFGEYSKVGNDKGDWSYISDGGNNIGIALRTKKNVKPVFVSQGYKIGMEFSREIILACSKKYRIPEPIRKAHIKGNQMRKTYI
jgi:deoxyribonuclease V